MFTGWLEISALAFVGFLSGLCNAVAGGGSLMVFPALMATGMSPLVANVTNSVAQGPGFVGAAWSQHADLRGNRRRFGWITVAAALGSAIGCGLLLVLPGSVFDVVVPVLLLVAAVLMAFQNRIRGWLGNPDPNAPDRIVPLTAGVFVSSIYGGYFGGARSVILMAVMMLAANDTLRRLNAAKNWTGLIGSAATFVVLALVAPVSWPAVLALVPTTLLGGIVGGKLAQRLPATWLRRAMVAIALGVAIYMFFD